MQPCGVAMEPEYPPQRQEPYTAQRSIRSRDGCITCKRRKMKCDESRPRCAHCERLNMECKWAPPIAMGRQRRRPTSMVSNGWVPPASVDATIAAAGAVAVPDVNQEALLRTPVTASDATSSGPDAVSMATRYAVDQIFDYASFMWDSEDMWQQQQQPHQPHQQMSPPARPRLGFEAGYMAATPNAEQVRPPGLNSPPSTSFQDRVSVNGSEPSNMSDASLQLTGSGSISAGLTLVAAQQPPPVENHRLIDYFIHAVTPPILVEIETPKKWFAMRRILVKMASGSRMVRWALLAFSAQLLRRRDGDWMVTSADHDHGNHYYEDAAAEVIGALSDEKDKDDSTTVTGGGERESSPAQSIMSLSLKQHSPHRENLLAAVFFLSYVDILENRNEAAHSHLKRAYRIFRQARSDSLVAVEKQLFLWIRLLDARVASTGGEGLFLSKDTEALLVQASPASLGGPDDLDSNTNAGTGCSGQAEGDMEDVLFQVLYQPGIVFFQKVQSFMGRISNIDPWHRSRGTVEDEIEVMNTGAGIAADLRALYEQRPLLMDYAVAGRLTAPYVTAHLATVVTRAFRTYLSNYYASKIHLHRVAYKMFPLTKEASEALDQIRSLAKLIGEGLDQEDAMPVSMLWPLLMLGSEEQDREERVWIKAQILRMEKVAGNARITAQVLEEVQNRQDMSKSRVDIRAVMHDIFNACFAIV